MGVCAPESRVAGWVEDDRAEGGGGPEEGGEEMGEESEGSDSRRAGKRKWEDAHALREEIGKLYQEER